MPASCHVQLNRVSASHACIPSPATCHPPRLLCTPSTRRAARATGGSTASDERNAAVKIQARARGRQARRGVAHQREIRRAEKKQEGELAAAPRVAHSPVSEMGSADRLFPQVLDAGVPGPPEFEHSLRHAGPATCLAAASSAAAPPPPSPPPSPPVRIAPALSRATPEVATQKLDPDGASSGAASTFEAAPLRRRLNRVAPDQPSTPIAAFSADLGLGAHDGDAETSVGRLSTSRKLLRSGSDAGSLAEESSMTRAKTAAILPREGSRDRAGPAANGAPRRHSVFMGRRRVAAADSEDWTPQKGTLPREGSCRSSEDSTSRRRRTSLLPWSGGTPSRESSRQGSEESTSRRRRRSLLPSPAARRRSVSQARKQSVKRIMRARFRQVQNVERISAAHKFRGLPTVLVVPNLELTLLIVLAAGLMEAAVEMLVAYFTHPAPPGACGGLSNGTVGGGGNNTASGTACVSNDEGSDGLSLTFAWFALSLAVAVGLLWWVLWVGLLLRDFRRHHSRQCWVPAAGIGETDPAAAATTPSVAHGAKRVPALAIGNSSKAAAPVANVALATGASETRTPAAAEPTKAQEADKEEAEEEETMVERIEEAVSDAAAAAARAAGDMAEDMADLLEDAKEEVFEEVSAIRRTLRQIFTARRAARRAGAYERPEADAVEPARTEAALALVWKGSVCKLPKVERTAASAGLSLDMLMSFLDAGQPSRRGTYHTFLMLLLQLTFASLVGGLKGPGAANMSLAVLQVSLLALMQLLMALWAVCGDPSDKLLGLTGFLCSLFELASSCMLLAAHYTTDADSAARMGKMAVDVFKVAIFTPLALALNDTLVVPVVAAANRIVQRGRAERWPVRRILLEVLLALLRLPLEFLVEVIGQVLPWVSFLLFKMEETEMQEEPPSQAPAAAKEEPSPRPAPAAAKGELLPAMPPAVASAVAPAMAPARTSKASAVAAGVGAHTRTMVIFKDEDAACGGTRVRDRNAAGLHSRVTHDEVTHDEVTKSAPTPSSKPPSNVIESDIPHDEMMGMELAPSQPAHAVSSDGYVQGRLTLARTVARATIPGPARALTFGTCTIFDVRAELAAFYPREAPQDAGGAAGVHAACPRAPASVALDEATVVETVEADSVPSTPCSSQRVTTGGHIQSRMPRAVTR